MRKVGDDRDGGHGPAVLDRRRLWSDAAAMKRLANAFDLLISTVPKAYPMQSFINVLKPDATLVNVGAMQALKGINGINLVYARESLAGSMIGGIAETQEVIDYGAARHLKADIELVRADRINEAIERVVNETCATASSSSTRQNGSNGSRWTRYGDHTTHHPLRG